MSADPRRGPLDPRLLRRAPSARPWVAAVVLVSGAQALVTVLVAGILAALVTALVALEDPARAGALPMPGAGVGTWLGLLGAALGLRAALAWGERVLTTRAGSAAVDDVRRAALAAALRRGPAWIAAYGPARLGALLSSGLDALRPWFDGYLPSLVIAGVVPPLVVAAMLLVDPASGIIVLLTLPLVPVFAALVGWATAERARQRWVTTRRLTAHFLDVVAGLPTLRLYGRAQRQVDVVAQMTRAQATETARVLRLAFLSSTALDLVGTLSVGLVAVEAGLRVAAGTLDLLPALLLILLAPEAYRPLREVGARFHAAADATAVVEEVENLLAVPDARDTARLRPGTPAWGPARASALDVRVRHPGTEVDALHLPHLSVTAGELVALQGPSGAGKTTALRVLAGIQPGATGAVEVVGGGATGGRDGLVYVPQRPTLPHARTVADALDVLAGDDERWAALADVGLADEIAALPLALATPLGEGGAGLSSGQRQRLALARALALVAHHPRLLLLDEPTAHLDAAAEQLVIARLRQAAARGSAVLVVSHRRALLAAADRTLEVHPPQPLIPAPVRPGRAAATASAGPPDHGVRMASDEDRPQALPPAEAAWSRQLLRRASRSAPVAVTLGATSWLAGLLLTAAATWLLVRASAIPPVLTLSTAVVLVRGSAVARPLLRYLERLVSHEVAFDRLGRWRSQVYAELVPRVPGPGPLRRGALLTRVVDDVDARVDGLLRGQLPALSALLALLVAAGAATAALPLSGAAVAAGLLVAGVLAPLIGAREAVRREAAVAGARDQVIDALTETLDGAEELAARGVEEALRLPDRRSAALAVAEARSAWWCGAATALGHVGVAVAVLGAAAAAAYSRALGPEAAAVLVLVALALTEPAQTLVDAAVARQRAAAARTRLRELATAPVVAGEPVAPRPLPVSSQLTVRGLVAGWDPARPPALHGLDLKVDEGEKVALLGPSGSGKSTLVAVIARLLDPAGGHVLLGGIDIRELAGADVRRRVAVVGDHGDHLFDSTLRENLRLAAPDADDARLVAVLERVRLGPWLAGLPAGLSTRLGDGTISGGERRRLAAARALLVNPTLLVLDEPTEGLDEPTAEALVADLLDAASHLGVLLLTHRSEGLDKVDAVHRLPAAHTRTPPGPPLPAHASV
ncbi:thiol reductant ABC exporter subunit CydD [Cellulomonas marina]|uniref:ATP-binding cassette, subfamily C, CydCD n=1 Tax=Cellulomonas marina TaxID=988821 RepID=A0A1I0YWH3_9CELL|nr:thiol reductant ABC exporter subunit CydD [Cellulomonas marina]GIG28069.1 ABC transporter [Cellulomonas marina]SFB17694.1 ATP-binding cassette, subfamily C, CydCD [Cellulomonas marina]